MSFKKLLTLTSVLAIASGVIAVLPGSVAAQSGNLLQNPGMEQPYQDNKQPNSWSRWFEEIQKPNNATELQYAVKPNFNAETNASGKHPELVLGGDASAHIGRQYDPWIGGISQVVNNIPPGSQVRFCAYSRLYAQNADYGKASSVTSMDGRSQVGVFLDGAVNWDASGVVWSGTANPHDNWQNVCVTAGPVGPSGTVTVFTKNDWRGSGAIHLDAWWDNAELVTLGTQPTAQPPANQPAAQPQPQQPAQPQPQPISATPDAQGSIVHTIVAGDTLFALSLQYNVPLDQIYALNSLNSQSILSIGQKVIIKGGPGASGPAQAQPTTAAAAPTQAAAQSTPPAAGTPEATQPAAAPAAGATQVVDQSNAGKLCVFAFEDANGDGLRQPDEASVADAKFSVMDTQGAVVGEHVSTDSSDAYCFANLTPGSYTVAVQPAPDTTATSDKRWGVALTGGSQIDINFGSRGATGVNTEVSSSSKSSTKPATSSIGGLLGGAVGLVLLLVAGVLGAFIIARRRS